MSERIVSNSFTNIVTSCRGRSRTLLRVSVLLAGAIGLLGATQALGAPACKPVLGFREVRLAPMQPPTLERTWSATVTVDASRCAANAQGHFVIGFSRLKETGPDMDFRERFTWQPPAVYVAVEFWADEAVERYWLETVTPCPCGD
jgi:hypothetical protein